jgi:1-aminocyclopropane-1-carboxylate deaminase/D-cysteine desulfhydrase-like pyridoxal-dependent ACC family enzyme
MRLIKIGPGGTVTQATSKSTGVEINRPCGQITMHNAALAAAAEVGFTVTNSEVDANDIVVVCIGSGATAASYTVTVDAVAAGSFTVTVGNHSAGSLGEAIVLHFAVIKNNPA